MEMEKLTITDIQDMKRSEMKNLEGTLKFSSAVTLGIFIKKTRGIGLIYTTDYRNFTVTFEEN